MIEIKRNEFKGDEVYRQIYYQLLKIHKVAPHTEKNLLENSHIKDFCEEARHFLIMDGRKPLYMHYDVASWYQEPGGAVIKIESITFYDDELEYNVARLKELGGGRPTENVPHTPILN